MQQLDARVSVCAGLSMRILEKNYAVVCKNCNRVIGRVTRDCERGEILNIGKEIHSEEKIKGSGIVIDIVPHIACCLQLYQSKVNSQVELTFSV